jgi:hypothetical protein
VLRAIRIDTSAGEILLAPEDVTPEVLLGRIRLKDPL